MDLHSTDTVIRTRRLGWWKDILIHREHNEQLLAALLGTLVLEDLDGTYTGTTPWIRLIQQDLRAVAHATNGTDDAVMECALYGDSHVLDDKWFPYLTRTSIRKVPSDGEAIPNPAQIPDYQCDFVDPNSQ